MPQNTLILISFDLKNMPSNYGSMETVIFAGFFEIASNLYNKLNGCFVFREIYVNFALAFRQIRKL